MSNASSLLVDSIWAAPYYVPCSYYAPISSIWTLVIQMSPTCLLKGNIPVFNYFKKYLSQEFCHQLGWPRRKPVCIWSMSILPAVGSSLTLGWNVSVLASSRNCPRASTRRIVDLVASRAKHVRNIIHNSLQATTFDTKATVAWRKMKCIHPDCRIWAYPAALPLPISD